MTFYTNLLSVKVKKKAAEFLLAVTWVFSEKDNEKKKTL